MVSKLGICQIVGITTPRSTVSGERLWSWFGNNEGSGGPLTIDISIDKPQTLHFCNLVSHESQLRRGVAAHLERTGFELGWSRITAGGTEAGWSLPILLRNISENSETSDLISSWWIGGKPEPMDRSTIWFKSSCKSLSMCFLFAGSPVSDSESRVSPKKIGSGCNASASAEWLLVKKS